MFFKKNDVRFLAWHKTGTRSLLTVIGAWIQAQLEDYPKKNTISFLDGVRACACLVVIWYHVYQIPRDLQVWQNQPFASSLINALLYCGKFGVTLFFVLSGFLLFMPFAKSLLFAQTWPSTRRFYLRRVFRIMPAYYLSLLLIILLFQHQYIQPQHWKELGLFFVFLMDSSQATFKQLNAPFWTLAVEWQYYILLPLLVLGMRQIVWRVKHHHRLLATFVCVLTLIAWGLFSRYVGTYFTDHPSVTFLVPRSALNGMLFFMYGISGKYFEDFGVGMLLSLCLVYAKQPEVSSRIRTLLQKLSPWLWGVGLLSLCTMVLWSYNQRYVNTWPLFSQPLLLHYYYLVSELCFALSFGLCILALLFGPTRLRKPFEWSPLRWLGMISYSLYMWHLPLLIAFIQLGPTLPQEWPPELVYGLYWLLMLSIIIPFSFLFFLLVEKPGIKLGETLQSRNQHTSRATHVHALSMRKVPAEVIPHEEARKMGK